MENKNWKEELGYLIGLHYPLDRDGIDKMIESIASLVEKFEQSAKKEGLEIARIIARECYEDDGCPCNCGEASYILSKIEEEKSKLN